MNTIIRVGVGMVMMGVAQAQAQSTCPTDTMVSTVMVPGFSCMVQDKTFSAFALSGVPADTRIQFGLLQGELFAVTLARDGTFFPDGRVVFDYTVSASGGNHILGGSVGVDVSFPTVVTTTTFNGMLVGPIVNGGTEVVAFAPGVTSVVVDDTATISGFAQLNSLTNDFAQVAIGVPEPSEWVLALAGILGLAWVWRRQRA